MKNEQCLPASTRVKVKKYASMHVEKLARLELCQWSGLLLRGSSPLSPPAMVASARGLQGRGLCKKRCPPAFRIAKFVTDLVTLPEKIVR
jgi:hypothetical protein